MIPAEGTPLYVVLIVLLNVPGGFLLEESFCAGIPHGKDLGLESIGGENIFLPGHEYINTAWVANRNESTYWLTHRLNLEVRGVRDTNGRVVNGWLSLVLSQKTRDPFVVAAVWALTEQGESIGEFVHPSIVDCIGRPSFEGRKNYIPCSAVSINHPMNSNMFAYSTSLPPTQKEFNLLWRASFTHCNYGKMFRFMVAGSTPDFPKMPPNNYDPTEGKTKWGLYQFTSGWIKPSYYGPAGSIPINGDHFDCSSKKKISNEKLDWLEEIYDVGKIYGWNKSDLTMGVLGNLWYYHAWVDGGRTYDSKIDIKRAVCKAASKGKVKFGGRCTEKVDIRWQSSTATKRIYAKETLVQKCHPTEDSLPSLQKYNDGIGNRDQQVSDECFKCPPVPTRDEVINARKTSPFARTVMTRRKKKPESRPRGIDPPTNPYIDNALRCHEHDSKVDPNEAGLCLDSVAGKVVYGVRQWHTVTMLVSFVLITPVVTFRARYLKGYILSTEKRVPLGSWYKFHITTLLPIVCMFTSSMGAISRQKSLFGYSVTGYGAFHRVGGYILFVLWFLLVITGALRPVNLYLRKVFIVLHWAGGWTYQYFGLLVCILTYRIPGSPTSFHSHVTERLKFKTIWYNMAPTILVIWGVVDISFHIFMTIRVILFDIKMGHKRSTFPIIIPLQINRKEMPLDVKDAFDNEDRFNENMLVLYVVFAIIAFIACTASIYNFNVGVNQGFGWMYCTHDDNGFIGQIDRSNDYWYCNT